MEGTTILFASGNHTKLIEVRYIFKKYLPDITIVTPNVIGINLDDVEETGTTYVENAKIKALAAYDRTGGMIPIISDDAGYEVCQWNRMPGIFTHRLLHEYPIEKLDMTKSTTTYQCSAVCYCRRDPSSDSPKISAYSNTVVGKLTNMISGNYGSYYMNSFIPNGYDKTFVELGLETICDSSARAKNLKAVIDVIKNERI